MLANLFSLKSLFFFFAGLYLWRYLAWITRMPEYIYSNVFASAWKSVSMASSQESSYWPRASNCARIESLKPFASIGSKYIHWERQQGQILLRPLVGTSDVLLSQELFIATTEYLFWIFPSSYLQKPENLLGFCRGTFWTFLIWLKQSCLYLAFTCTTTSGSWFGFERKMQ